MSKYHFQGDFVTRRKVDLRGRTKAEENRAQIVERTRRDREKRRKQKLEVESATRIQVRTWGPGYHDCSTQRSVRFGW